MQPNGNVIVDTICRTAKLGTTITGATENGDVTVIEAEPVEPINECPTCGQPGVFRDHVIRSLVDLPIVGHPTTSCAPSTLPVHQQALLAEDNVTSCAMQAFIAGYCEISLSEDPNILCHARTPGELINAL